MIRALVLSLVVSVGVAGCIAPGDRLRFPTTPLHADAAALRYDTDGSGHADFSLERDDRGAMRLLGYDDDEDGTIDRVFRIEPARASDVPHLIVLMDSIPFEAVRERCADPASPLAIFDPPTKVIPPFPTMSPVIFSRMIGAPPMPGPINQYYDRTRGKRVDRVYERTTGRGNPWERRLHYRLKYWENGLSFLYPRRWFRVELARAKKAFDASPDRVTLVYFASPAGMVSKHGAEGVEECLDGLEQLVAAVLHERRGAVMISALSDHGHNLRSGERIDLEVMLREAGFTPRSTLGAAGAHERVVVVEQDGLVNYAGVHTRHAAEVAAALAARPEIGLAMYVDGEDTVVLNRAGAARVSARDGRFRYVAHTADVLHLSGVVDALREAGRVDADGFISAEDWFEATADHQWPDAPRRVWEAFRGVTVHAPDVMITTAPGYYAGLSSFDWWVDMASTHGGLDQVDSAAFLLTTTGRGRPVMKTEDVLRAIEPRYDPDRLRR